MIKRLISFLLILTALFTVLCGCKSNTEPAVNGTAGEQTSSPVSDGDGLVLADSSATDYVIVYPTKADDDVKSTVKMLQNVFKNYYGADIKAEPDDDHKTAPAECEILVGNTNRPESAEYSDLKYSDFIIEAVGKKVVITAPVTSGITAAVNYFVGNTLKASQNASVGGRATLASDYSYRYSASYKSGPITLGSTDASEFSIIVSRTAGDFENALAEGIQKTVGTACGAVLPIKNDRSAVTAHEIIIGETTRELSDSYYASPVDVSAYGFYCSGGSIIFVVGGEEAAQKALKYFKEAVASANGGYDMLSLDGKSFITTLENTERYEGTELRLMTNNILFTSSAPAEERAGMLAKIYLAYLPDVLCLQEVDPDWYPLLTSKLSDEYAFVNAYPQGKQLSDNLNPILYRKDKFDVLESSCYTTITQFNSEITYAVLKERATQNVYIVYSIHLLVDSLSSTAEQQRQASARRLLDKITELKATYSTEYAFVLGDYNAVETTGTYAMFRAEMDDAKYIAEVRANTTLNTGHTIGQMPTEVSKGARNYDYIMVNGNAVRVLTHDIITNEFAINGSDHCPVYVDLILK